MTTNAEASDLPDVRTPRRVLGTTCGAHALHDGYMDASYVLLPLWQAEYGLAYGAVGLLRAVHLSLMAACQIPAATVAKRVGSARILALGTLIVGLGYVIAGLDGGLVFLVVGLAVCGLGASVQHPIGSDLVARTFPGRRSRSALGTYNFAGDIGKAAVPAALAVLLTWVEWPAAMTLLGIGGAVAAMAILAVLGGLDGPRVDRPVLITLPPAAAPSGIRVPTPGFALLLSSGMLDTAIRTGFPTLLPFLLVSKGADTALVGVALSLLFAGGAGGKLAFGFVAERFGIVRTAGLAEVVTAVGILAVLAAPLAVAVVLLPLLGLVMSGTSSVLYGTVPELVPAEQRARAFGVFYTGIAVSGMVAPVVFGQITDAAGLPTAMAVVAASALVMLPPLRVLAPRLNR
ncbi:MAG TPA: MFS transporter [Azospirillaceae bacterium]|nr:MFS transporter [Azospirillaceae bacterium]